MTTFFTADTHFGHANIIKYCNRPFNTVEEMDYALVRNWNSVVNSGDIVYHLGDFCFGNFEYYFKRLNGKIIFIEGNHDKEARKYKNRTGYFYDYYYGFYEATINEQLFVLCHYAMRIWNKSHYGSYHLYGHSHGSLLDDLNSRSIDVGVDTNNFFPYSYDQIITLMSKKIFVPIDHHTGK